MMRDREGGLAIVYDHQVFGGQRFGGISRYFSEIAARIAAIGPDQVAVTCPFYVNNYLARAGVRRIGIRVPDLRKTARIRTALNRALSKLVVPWLDADIFHETYYDTADHAPRGAKRILTVFDMIHERLPESFDPADRTPLLKARSIERADHLICISNTTKQHLLEVRKVPPAKVSVVHLGFLDASSVGEQSAIAPQRPFVLYVGARRGYKNFAGVLKAYAASRRLREELSLVCFGGGPFTAVERAAAVAAGIAPNHLAQVGGLDEDLGALYRSATAFVYPSLEEGFGMPPLEAMSAGCPVACSDVPCMAEVVGDAAERFDPRSPESIAHSIEAIAFADVRRRELVARGAQRTRLFSWARCAAETLAVYRKVVSG